MHIQPGTWVAVGCIGDVHPRTLVEINLSTWKWRETLELAEPRETPLPHGQEIPPAPRQAAS
jgi:hypothetical protein